MFISMNLWLIILTLALRLSLNAAQNDLGKQIAALQIKFDKQEAELKELKSIAVTQNEKISLLNKLNRDLREELQNQSGLIDDLQNQQKNFTYQSLESNAMEPGDGSRLQQEIYELFNASDNQQRQIEYLMDQRKELKENDTIIWQMIQAEINTVDIKFLNITEDQYKHIKHITTQNERLQNAIQLEGNKASKLVSALNESYSKKLDEQRNELINIEKTINQGVQNENFVRLEFMNARGYLGCPYDVCDLRSCPLYHFKNFGTCTGEGFQILGEGGGSIKSGQRVHFRYVRGGNEWLGCPHNNWCDKRPCPGTITSAAARNLNTCWGERFVIYARGRHNGEEIQNRDTVAIYFPANGSEGKPGYITIRGAYDGADTSLTSCLGSRPPAHFQYSQCPSSVFRIHRKP